MPGLYSYLMVCLVQVYFGEHLVIIGPTICLFLVLGKHQFLSPYLGVCNQCTFTVCPLFFSNEDDRGTKGASSWLYPTQVDIFTYFFANLHQLLFTSSIQLGSCWLFVLIQQVYSVFGASIHWVTSFLKHVCIAITQILPTVFLCVGVSQAFHCPMLLGAAAKFGC